MYKIFALLYCFLLGTLISQYGWIAIIWTSIGYIFALFATSNIVLPPLMGVPLALPLVRKKLMKPSIFIGLLKAPIIWLTAIIVLGLIFTKAVEWILQNPTLKIGVIFGIINILSSPFSKKARTDFKEDFDESYAHYYTNHTDFKLNHIDINDKEQQVQIEAIIRIASNFYLNQLSYSFDILNLKYYDSKFRCMIFCVSTVINACKDLLYSNEILQKEAVHLISFFVTSKENCVDYFNEIVNAKSAEDNATVYFKEFMDYWTVYNSKIDQDNKDEATKVLCQILHLTESESEFSFLDEERLIPLACEIEVSFIAMRSAFNNIINQKS